MYLKLLMQLKSADTASIVLKSDDIGRLRYFIVSPTVNYTLVSTGLCEGDLPDNSYYSFDIMLSSIASLVDKGFDFSLRYRDGKLLFETTDGKLTVEPLCVEHRTEEAIRSIDRVLEFDESAVREVDLSPLKRIASIASRCNTVVDLCDTYACVSLASGYALQKAECPTLSIQGALLSRLLTGGSGKFFMDGKVLTYIQSEGKDTLYIFVNSFLPTNPVDPSVIVKGVTEEKYKVNLSGLLSLIYGLLPKFNDLYLDMGEAKAVLKNELGEIAVSKFEVYEAKTKELQKLLAGKASGEIVMSKVVVPKEVQKFLSYFTEDFTLYLKKRKIIFESSGLYFVYGRVYV